MRWSAPGPAFLFCPGDRPERFRKASHLADVVILDLEDGVDSSRRVAARNAIRCADLDPTVTVVRINPVSTIDHLLDLEALRDSPFRKVMLAKTSAADDVRGLDDFEVIALCETPQGLAEASTIAQCPNTIALMWGAEDLVACLGGVASRFDDGTLRDVARYARAHVLLAAGQHDVGALDTVYIDYADLQGQRAEAADAAAIGFMATACIHPSQAAVIRDAYRPSPDRLEWAKEVLALAENRGGAFGVDGQMVDGPVLAQARQLLRRSGERAV